MEQVQDPQIGLALVQRTLSAQVDIAKARRMCPKRV